MQRRNPNDPLGLPKGSVRAILALVVVIAFVGIVVTTTVRAAWTGGMDPADVLDKGFQLAMLAMVWYFAKTDQPTA